MNTAMFSITASVWQEYKQSFRKLMPNSNMLKVWNWLPINSKLKELLKKRLNSFKLRKLTMWKITWIIRPWVYSWSRTWVFLYCFVRVFRCRGVSRRSWTARWGGTAAPSSVTEAVCPTWRPPSGRCYGSALWPLCSSPMWPSVTPGTPKKLIRGHNGSKQHQLWHD